jgi:steroid delta-isomerase-like uncharacterized protein
MTDSARKLVVRWFDEVWNKKRREVIAEILAPDAVLHESGSDSVGPEGFYAFFDRFHAAFSDFEIVVHDTIAEDDRVCARWTCRCKHTGDALGMPATQKTIQMTGISIICVVDGRFVEGWQNWDMLGMLQQIQGAQPASTYVSAP